MVQELTIEADTSEKEAIVYLTLGHQYNLSRIDVLKGKEVEDRPSSLNDIIRRLNKNEPLQYILEEAWFYGRKFFVSPAVLIPRPETELIIKLVSDRISKPGEGYSIIDVGTGSGCIAISLALEFPSSTMIATDISNSALEVASQNAQKLKAIVNFKIHDILNDPLDFGVLDMIVSNPPYVSESERSLMQKNVTDHEPALALFVPNPDPLLFYKALAKQANESLKPGGYLITEISERFGKETAEVFTRFGLTGIEVVKDLDGKDRYVVGRK